MDSKPLVREHENLIVSYWTKKKTIKKNLLNFLKNIAILSLGCQNASNMMSDRCQP